MCIILQAVISYRELKAFLVVTILVEKPQHAKMLSCSILPHNTSPPDPDSTLTLITPAVFMAGNEKQSCNRIATFVYLTRH